MKHFRLDGAPEFSAAIDTHFSAGAIDRAQSRASSDLARDVEKAVKSKGSSLGGAAAGAVRRGAVTSGSSAKQAWFELKNGAVPLAFGAEFGSKQYARFSPYRGGHFESGGYFFSPTIRDFPGLKVDRYFNDYSPIGDALKALAG